MLVVPIAQNSAWFEFTCELDDVAVTFTFRFNDRDGCWYFDLSDARGTLLVAGLKAITAQLLLGAVRGTAGLPPGDLLLVDTAGQDEDPSFDSIGRRHLLFYVTEDELLELAA